MRGIALSFLIIMLLLSSTFGMILVSKPAFAYGNRLTSGERSSYSKPSSIGSAAIAPETEAAGSGGVNDAAILSDNAVDDAPFYHSSDYSYVQGNKTRLVVGIDSEKLARVAELEGIAERYQARIVDQVMMYGKVRALVFELLLISVTGFSEDVRASELATYLEPNMKIEAQYVPNDPYWSVQWGPRKIEADWAWNTTVGDSSVLVAVVDTGIDYTHPDLAANYVALGRDWANNDTDPIDDYGHGTHCAGIIAAVLNNGVGIAGIAQVKVMAEKVLDAGGYGYADWVANGIIHATDCGARIISMSIGGWGDSELVHEAIKYAYDAGVLLVAAAGNSGSNMKPYPAGYEEVVSVAATDEYDSPAYFSNWGDWIELAAPGVNVYSTVPGGYASKSGTSMACPHVAGVAALVWSKYPNGTRDWVRTWLRYAADDLGAEGFDVHYGYGRVNARKAVQLSPPTHELIAYKLTTPPYLTPGTSALVNATLLNFGNDETNVEVKLLANDTLVDSKMIGYLPAETSVEVTFAWLPAAEGLYNIKFYAVPVLGEVDLENNGLSKSLFVGFPLKVVVLHSAGNVLSNIITSWQTLNDEWYLFGDKMVYIDYATLNKEGLTYADIAATEADVLVISCAYDPYAGWQFTDSEIDAIGRYVREGHGLIATAGTLYEGAPNNNKLAPLFGLSEKTVWDATYTDLLEQWNSTHPVFRNVPNPFVFAQVGTSIPSDQTWDSNELVDGTYLATGHYLESAIVVNRGLVYISPWLEAIPPYYHFNLQVLYNAMTWSKYAKPEHEIAVSIECPKHIDPGQGTLINASVHNDGLRDETDVELRLLINDTIVASVTVPELAADSSYTLIYPWAPTVDGRYNVTVYAPPVPNEDFVRNNVASITVRVGYVTAAIAVLNSLDIPPYFSGGLNNNYQLLVDALNSEGFYAESITNEEIMSGKLESFDVFAMVDNVPSEAAVPYVVAFWSNGGGLIGFDSSICFLNYAGVLPPESAGGNGQGTYWGYSTVPEARVSAEHAITEGYEVGEIIRGTGGDAAYWVNALASSSAYPYYTALVEDVSMSNLAYVSAYDPPTAGKVVHFWDQKHWGNMDLRLMITNAVNWVKRLRYEHDLVVSSVIGFRPAPGQTTAINATLRNMGLSNETGVELQLLINGSIVDDVTIPELASRESFTLSYSWTPMIEGVYNVTAYAPPVPGEGNTADNTASKSVNVRPTKYVLVDQTHGTDYIGSYNVWMGSLTERNYVVDSNFIEPITPDTLRGYDVLIIPQATHQYTEDEVIAIQDFVFYGGGLLVIGDDFPPIYSQLTAFAGIIWHSGGISGTTTDITPHPVTAGVSSIYLYAPIAAMILTGSAHDLVRDTAGGIMLSVSEASAGHVLGFADEDSLRDYGIGLADNLLLADNMLEWLSMAGPPEPADVAVTVLCVSPTDVYQGWNVTANVSVANLVGGPCRLNVSLYLDERLAAREGVLLYSNETLDLTLQCATLAVGAGRNYTVRAEASIVRGETNVTNNKWIDGSVNVRIVGDVNNDGKVDIYDCIQASNAFGAKPTEPEYQVFCDVNQDGIVDIFDMIQFSIHFGESA